MSAFKKVLVSLLFLPCNIALANTIPLTDCAQLNEPKTVLLVHAEWCGPCHSFLPTYTATSNKPEFADWKFYVAVDNDFHPVCGQEIKGVPTTFAKNMQVSLMGNVSNSKLESFVLDSQSSLATNQICKISDKK